MIDGIAHLRRRPRVGAYETIYHDMRNTNAGDAIEIDASPILIGIVGIVRVTAGPPGMILNANSDISSKFCKNRFLNQVG